MFNFIKRKRKRVVKKSYLQWQRDNWTDEDDLCPPAMEAQEALDFLKSYLLGDNWYVSMPLSTKQVNTVIVDNILRKYSTDYIAEVRNERRKKNDNSTFN